MTGRVLLNGTDSSGNATGCTGQGVSGRVTVRIRSLDPALGLPIVASYIKPESKAACPPVSRVFMRCISLPLAPIVSKCVRQTPPPARPSLGSARPLRWFRDRLRPPAWIFARPFATHLILRLALVARRPRQPGSTPTPIGGGTPAATVTPGGPATPDDEWHHERHHPDPW